jgi:hypothetical protein
VKKPKSNLAFDDKDFPISLVRRCVLQGAGIDIEEGKQKPIIASCDKIVPGMLMAAARLNLPAIFITGGPSAWSIRFKNTFTGSVDRSSYEDLADKLATAMPATCGACELAVTGEREDYVDGKVALGKDS